MTKQGRASLPNLFKQWRGGDAKAGQEMARRFSDWYYAITVSRLGEQDGRKPLKQACERFAREIVQLNSAARLMDWAQSIILDELELAGSRIPGGDFPNALTENRSPTELLRTSWDELSREQLMLLSHAYDSSYPLEQLVEEAEQAGGYPIAVLRSRLELKRWLRDVRGVPLAVVPDEPDLDCAPMPIYEAARMNSSVEEARFERWMLSRFELCRDVAEFAVFSLAIRAGALSDPPAPEAQPEAKPAQHAVTRQAAAPAAKPAGEGSSLAARLAVGGLALVALLVVIAVVLFRFVL